MRNKKKSRIIIIAVVAALIAAGGISASAVMLRGGSKPVNVYSMQEIAMDSYWGDTSETDGLVRTDKMQSVYISSTQTVTEVFVKEGQQVKAGDKLAAFDTTLSDLELERQKINVEKLELQLKNAKADLVTINGYKPYVPPTPTPEPEPTPLEPMELPLRSGGSGTAEKPYVYLWNDDCWYTDSFINTVLPLERADDTTSQPEESEQPDGGEETPDTEEPTQVKYKDSDAWVVFENREYDNTAGELIRYWGIHFTRNSDGSYKFAVYTPDPDYAGDDETPEPDPEPTPDPDPDTQYTAAEIAKMRSEKQKEITDLTLQVKVEKVKYEKLQLEINNGIVTAKLDGTIKTLADPDEAQANNTPFIVLSGGGGYYVQGTLSELELDTVKVGQTVNVNSWMSGTTAEGEIVEISEYPDTDGYHWTNGNQNVSFYPFTVFVNEDAALQENEYVSILYSPAETAGGIYLQKPFLLSENSKYYVYAANAEGKLEKREVTVGKSLYGGEYTEIISGVTMEDLVAFPYGKNLKEGAKTVEASMDDLYQSAY